MADPADPAADPQNWYIATLGGGVMILEPKFFGRAFLHETDTDGDLVFVGRAVSEAERE